MPRSNVTGKKIAAARPEPAVLDEADAYSIEEFCRRHRISVQQFYNIPTDARQFLCCIPSFDFSRNSPRAGAPRAKPPPPPSSWPRGQRAERADPPKAALSISVSHHPAKSNGGSPPCYITRNPTTANPPSLPPSTLRRSPENSRCQSP